MYETKHHKHHDVIVAYAKGAKVQYKYDGKGEWEDVTNPIFNCEHAYRVKPKEYPKNTLNYGDICHLINQTDLEAAITYESKISIIARLAADEAIKQFIESGEMVKYFTDPANGFIVKDN